MTYSPYGDRDSGGTRTDVDTEVHDDHDDHDDHDQEDRADDGMGHDANGHDGAATPFQRDATDDESVGGDVVDRDGNVVEAADGEVDGGDRSETVDADSAESRYAVDRQADMPDAETKAGAADDHDGDVQRDEAMAADVDTPERAEETSERDSATEQAMAGEDGPTEVPSGVVDEHDERNEADRSEADGDGFATGHADGEPVDSDPTAAGFDTYAEDDTEADQTAATDGALDEDRANAMRDGDGPIGGAVDADYVAVGVAEPLTESEAEDIADADGSDATRDADGSAVPRDASAEDGTAVGMMPGDASVPDAPAQMSNADATHDRWHQIQLGFIDDPRGSVESARSLVVEAVESRISALRDRQTALDGWQNEATPDTELLRAAIQGYRDMLNSLYDTP
jgi:hypothetical protein